MDSSISNELSSNEDAFKFKKKKLPAVVQMSQKVTNGASSPPPNKRVINCDSCSLRTKFMLTVDVFQLRFSGGGRALADEGEAA